MTRRAEAPARFELLTRAGCHLCDDMARVLDDVLPRHGLGYTAIDVDAEATLRERWGEEVPVLLRDGVAVAKARLERAQLRRIIERKR